jgi:hypothetical protein
MVPYGARTSGPLRPRFDTGAVLGWVGGLRGYGGNVWELHPLVVRPDRQRQGIGRALVADLEAQVRARGGLTLWLGSDDEDDMTSLSGVDLYDDLPGQLARIRNLKGHRILRAYQHEIGREGQAALRAADRDDFVFQGLPRHFLFVVTNGKGTRD